MEEISMSHPIIVATPRKEKTNDLFSFCKLEVLKNVIIGKGSSILSYINGHAYDISLANIAN
jgi:hypothetical protein